jgi:hypothetical protein
VVIEFKRAIMVYKRGQTPDVGAGRAGL